MSSNKAIDCNNCHDHLYQNFTISGRQIVFDLDFILFQDNPISNTELLRQIENRHYIDNHFIEVIRANIGSLDTNEAVITMLLDFVRFLSLRTNEQSISIDEDQVYQIIDDLNVFEDEDDDEYDDSYDNLEGDFMDEIELLHLYGNNRIDDN